MSDESQEDQDRKLLMEHVAKLAEHWDTVQIFVTRHDAEGTIHASEGSGNWFARYGSIKDWVMQQEEKTRSNTRDDDATE